MVVLIVVFSDFVEANAGWLRWVLFVGVLVAYAAAGTTRSELRGIGRERMVEIFETTGWLKIWFAVCAAAFIALAVYVVRNSVDLFSLFGLRFLVLSFVLLLGPFIVVSERERYKKLGEGENAI